MRSKGRAAVKANSVRPNSGTMRACTTTVVPPIRRVLKMFEPRMPSLQSQPSHRAPNRNASVDGVYNSYQQTDDADHEKSEVAKRTLALVRFTVGLSCGPAHHEFIADKQGHHARNVLRTSVSYISVERADFAVQPGLYDSTCRVGVWGT